jgi:hypothetical protein
MHRPAIQRTHPLENKVNVEYLRDSNIGAAMASYFNIGAHSSSYRQESRQKQLTPDAQRRRAKCQTRG